MKRKYFSPRFQTLAEKGSGSSNQPLLYIKHRMNQFVSEKIMNNSTKNILKQLHRLFNLHCYARIITLKNTHEIDFNT